jgi:hypothetical protein
MQVSRKSTLRNERNAFFALLGFAIAALVLPLPYLSVAASTKATPVFDLVDRNHDGRLGRVEFARW